MSIQVSCKSCGGNFNAPDTAAGKRTSCPKCGGVIEIPPAAPPEEILEAEVEPSQAFEDDEFEVEPPPETSEARRPCPKCGEMILPAAVKCRFCGEVFDKSVVGVVGGSSDFHRESWEKVRKGLSILYYSIMLIIVAVILLMACGMVAAIMGADGEFDDFPPIMIIPFALGGLVIVGAGIATIVGQVKCTNVPQNSGARGMAIGAALCMLFNIALSFIGGAADMEAINSLGSLFSVAGTVMFILFIRRSASFLGDFELSASAGRYLWFVIASIVGGITLAILGAVLQLSILLVVFGLGAVILALVFVVWYLKLIRALMLLIEHRLGTG